MSSTASATILVVEDEPAIRQGLADVLAFQGYEVSTAPDGEAGLELALGGGFQLLLLDVMLPGVDGFTICSRVRERFPEQAVCMLTAKGSEEDILKGFEVGADDYVTKPFSVKQLLARVESLLRRCGGRRGSEMQIGELCIDVDGLRASLGERSIDLTQRDIEVLGCLARERGSVISRQQLLQEVWGFGQLANVETRCVDMHLVKLRRKLQKLMGEAGRDLIETVRGAGYRLKEELAA